IAGGNLRDQLNVGPLPRGGNGTTVGSTGSSLNQKTGATFKIISDTEDWDRTLAINSPGQSGNPENEHYDDLFELWASDQYFPLFYSKAKIESVLDQTIILLPE
ncbi:MAG: penicillin acylase family protein, partial [Saprospiraceae bacterium]|nr:penicillin acylase family protein [Saprospiraceae bacterium]